MEPEIRIVADKEVREIIVRKGNAPAVYDPVPLRINGQITAPARFYEARKAITIPLSDTVDISRPYFDKQLTHVLVDREAGTITLTVNESDNFYTQVVGTLGFSPEYEMLAINTGRTYTPAELGKLLRKNRHLFPDVEKGMELVSQLLNFKAKTTADVQQAQDTRGNKKNNFEIAVETNTPLDFRLKIPIFKGFAPVTLKIEISLDSRAAGIVDCFLESPDALKQIAEERDAIFTKQLETITADGITVIEL